VLGVLIEKAKTTPAAYPMTVNAIVAGCNQKSNRDPLMTLDDTDVSNVLVELRDLDVVTELDWLGRVPKYKHKGYEWLGVNKAEMAVMTELLLRGAQALGELRARAARMEPIADLAALKPIVDGLVARGLMIELTPPGRGQIVSHKLYLAPELEELRSRHSGRSRGPVRPPDPTFEEPPEIHASRATREPKPADAEVRRVAATVHGRYAVRAPLRDDGRRRWLVGFHGYAHNAEIFLETLRDIPGADAWRLASVQGLHPFYNRANEVVANWMTRQDREHAIADNIAYVDAVLEDMAAAFGAPETLVFAGFSQGVAMAYRAGVYGARPPRAIIVAGGDMPPELATGGPRAWPIVMIATGRGDAYYTPQLLERDAAFLTARGADVRKRLFEGGHEWAEAVRVAAGELLGEIGGG
jgi:predicted esterase